MQTLRRNLWIPLLYKGWSICTGFSLVLLLFGLAMLVLVKSLQIASFAWLIAWLLTSKDLYPEMIGSGPSLIKRAYPLLLLAFGYVIIWFGFIVLSYRGSFLITLYIYGVGVLFLLVAKYSSNNALRSRLTDDLFLIIITFTAFVLIKTLFSPQESASATVLGTTVDYVRDNYEPLLNLLLTPINQDVANSIFTALTNNAVIEYYGYSIWLLWLLDSTKDIPREKRKVPVGVLGGTLTGLGIILVLYEMLQAFITLSSNRGSSLLSANTVINLIIAAIVSLFLILANQRKVDPEVTDGVV